MTEPHYAEWEFCFWAEWYQIALPLRLSWGFDFKHGLTRLEIGFLFFRFEFWRAWDEELPPEEELRQLNEYSNDMLRMISEEREAIQNRMGTFTR
jgi:hypothetical protein